MYGQLPTGPVLEPAMPRKKISTNRVTLELPAEFIALCKQDKTEPAIVLRGFIADLCALELAEAGYLSNGTSARLLARWYFAGVGYARWPR